MITFDAYCKYKKKCYYQDTLVLITDDNPTDNQRKMTEFVLNDKIILRFFDPLVYKSQLFITNIK